MNWKEFFTENRKIIGIAIGVEILAIVSIATSFLAREVLGRFGLASLLFIWFIPLSLILLAPGLAAFFSKEKYKVGFVVVALRLAIDLIIFLLYSATEGFGTSSREMLFVDRAIAGALITVNLSAGVLGVIIGRTLATTREKIKAR